MIHGRVRSLTNITFVGILGFVSYFVYEFLDPPHGQDRFLIPIGIVATLSGLILAEVSRRQFRNLGIYAIVFASIIIFIFSFGAYDRMSSQPPTNCEIDIFCPAYISLLCAAGVFCCMGLLANLSRVKLASYMDEKHG